jgi:hypothetical protein
MKTARLMIIFAACAMGMVTPLLADQVAMQNGDKYIGKVLSLTTNTLVLQNENLGNVTLPRSKITSIILGTGTATTTLVSATSSNLLIRQSVASSTNSVSDVSAALPGLRSETNLIQQVQSQILGSAGPEATTKFNELLDGLSTGKIGLSDLRAEAKSAANQLRSLKKELGPDASSELEGYLAILDSFLKETAPVNAATNSSRSVSKGKPDSTRVKP